MIPMIIHIDRVFLTSAESKHFLFCHFSWPEWPCVAGRWIRLKIGNNFIAKEIHGSIWKKWSWPWRSFSASTGKKNRVVQYDGLLEHWNFCLKPFLEMINSLSAIALYHFMCLTLYMLHRKTNCTTHMHVFLKKSILRKPSVTFSAISHT